MKTYKPTKGELKILNHVYEDFNSMETERNNRWRQFNDRDLKEYLDDCEKRVNCYVPPENDKEDWQANFFHPVTRNKLKAIIAAVALGLPRTEIKAQNEEGGIDYKRAEIMRNLVHSSYETGNPEEDNFFTCWEMEVKGTAIEYEGHAITRYKRKEITSVDLVTGEVEWDEKEENVDDECVSFLIPLENMFIADFYIRDIQKQPYLAWADYMHERTFQNEFGEYKNAEFVIGWNKKKEETDSKIQAKKDQLVKDDELTFYTEDWKKRVTDKDFVEVLRYYNKERDEYIIVANGVMIMESPLLWGKTQKKYPFAKEISEPFSSGNFFYGKALPDTLMGEQDVINSLYNMAIDKTYRSLVPPMLIGDSNKDAFDLEDEETTMDTKIYVSDIAQVKPMDIQGVNPGDIKMMDIIGRGLDLSSVDANQQGVAGRGVTAREVVIANENAKKLKGMLYMFISNMWVQKYRLRILNILTYYTLPKVKKVVGEDGKENTIDKYRKFSVENTELSNGQQGTLGIEMVGSEKELPSRQELDVQSEMHRIQGKEYESIAITSDYLDEWEYDIKVTTESLYKEEDSLTQAMNTEKIKILATMFPQLFQQNQEKLFKDTIKTYKDNPDEYDMAAQALPAQEGGGGQEGNPVQNANQMGNQDNQLPTILPK